jgi:hypothetical protein
MLSTEEAVGTDLIMDMEAGSGSGSGSVPSGKPSREGGVGKCTQKNALWLGPNGKQINTCHFVGQLLADVFGHFAAILKKRFLALGAILIMIVPCAIQLGVKICVHSAEGGDFRHDNRFPELLEEFFVCTLCSLCKGYLNDMLCNALGDFAMYLFKSPSGGSAMEMAQSVAVESKTTFLRFFRKIKEAVACFKKRGSYGENIQGSCGKILSAVMAVFGAFPDAEDENEDGGGNGSNAPPSGSCSPVVNNVNAWKSAFMAFILEGENCGTCLKDAFEAKNRRKKPKNQITKNTFLPLKIGMQVAALFCCVSECNCHFQDTTCKNEKPTPVRKDCADMTKCEYIKNCSSYLTSKKDCENDSKIIVPGFWWWEEDTVVDMSGGVDKDAACETMERLEAHIDYKDGDC